MNVLILKISFNTIYRAIYAGMFDTPHERRSRGPRGAIRNLRHKGKTRHKKGMVEKRGKIKISNPIEERPEEANNRSRIGDWEADSVMSKTGGACLVTLVFYNGTNFWRSASCVYHSRCYQ